MPGDLVQEQLTFESNTVNPQGEFRILRVTADVDADGFIIEHIEDIETGVSFAVWELDKADQSLIRNDFEDLTNAYRDMKDGHPANDAFGAEYVNWINKGSL